MVYAKFTPTFTNVTTNPVTQWDYGRILRIEGLNLPTAIRIDFGVSGGQTTVGRIGLTQDGVTDVVIPDSLLEQSSNIVAYVYVSNTTEGKTVRTINIPVNARAKPEEYDSPESKELFAEAIEMINDVAVRAENAEAEAKSSADSARESLEATEQIAEAFPDTATAAVNAVNSAGAAQIQAISKKGVDSVADVETAKQESIAAVKAEGETQLQAIAAETALIVADRERINSNTRNKAGAIVLDAQGESIVLNDASEYPLQNLKLFGKSTQDGTPTPDAPVDIVSVENPVVNVCGKNLFDMSKIAPTDRITKNADGTLSVSQYANSTQLTLKELAPALCVGMKYKMNIDTDGAKFIYLTVLNSAWDNNKELEITENALNSLVNVYGVAGQTDGSTVIRSIQIVLSGVSSDYEQYKGLKSATIPRTLPGIPVSSGGNYTDENGQEWICDEVDLARGVYVQRVSERTLMGNEHCILNAKATEEGANVYQYYTESIKPIANAFYCSHFANAGQWMNGLDDLNNIAWHTRSVLMFKTDGVQTLEDFTAFVAAQYAANTPIKVWFAMETPIETPLSEAEIAAFKALHSNKPYTTILNDSGAHMAVSYVADTKTYIDNKIAALLSNQN